MKKNHSFLTPFGKKVATLATISIVAIFILGAYMKMVRQEVWEIKSDGGYYAVGEKTNEFGLPEMIKKPLE
ncbi:MAG: hypothetical protein RBS77_02520 [Candidatus Moranbacteria bacterium]|jgi:hypothetical protein|nr:hypothetical protein [Candidatus Moranbacteria bacterium]